MAENTIGEKELKIDWPVVTGLGADDKHEGRQRYLIPEKSFVPARYRVGLD